MNRRAIIFGVCAALNVGLLFLWLNSYRLDSWNVWVAGTACGLVAATAVMVFRMVPGVRVWQAWAVTMLVLAGLVAVQVATLHQAAGVVTFSLVCMVIATLGHLFDLAAETDSSVGVEP